MQFNLAYLYGVNSQYVISRHMTQKQEKSIQSCRQIPSQFHAVLVIKHCRKKINL